MAATSLELPVRLDPSQVTTTWPLASAAKRTGVGVFGCTVGCHKGNVEISFALAGASVVVDFDLGGDVSAVSGYEAACGGEGRGLDGFTRTGDVGEAAIVGALHFDIE